MDWSSESSSDSTCHVSKLKEAAYVPKMAPGVRVLIP